MHVVSKDFHIIDAFFFRFLNKCFDISYFVNLELAIKHELYKFCVIYHVRYALLGFCAVEQLNSGYKPAFPNTVASASSVTQYASCKTEILHL